MNIEKQLAAALRAVIDTAPGGVRANEADNIAAKRDGILALAAYDAQQAAPPACGPIAPGETIGETVDRVLGMADQFLEDWRESVDDDTARDSDLEEREQEWGVVRPLILQRVNAHDTLVSALRTILADKGSASFNDDLEAYDAAIQTASDALAQAGVNHA